MGRCPVCASEEFVADSEQMLCCMQCGFFSQDQCHLQCEQQEQTAANTGLFGTRARMYRALKTKKGPITKEQEAERPWKTDEGFQLIMMKQAEALTELNASPKLKEVVFHLWVIYLRKSGRAFSDKPLTPAERRKIFGTYRLRDRYPGTVDNPKLYSHHLTKKLLKALRMNEQMDKDAKAQLILKLEAQRLLHREEQYRSANHPELIRTEVQAPQFMTMHKTLCFMYLGLRLTNPDVQIYDLIRWVKQERLPYLKLSHFWPSEMMFHCHDNKTFIANRAPTTQEIFTIVNRLHKFLDLDVFEPPDLRACVKKIGMELMLPDEFIVYVDKLVAKNDPLTFIKDYHQFEVETASLAMSYIVITMKLLMGLDGTRERKTSSLALWLAKRIEFERPLFSFTDWIMHVQNTFSHSINKKKEKLSRRIVGIQSDVNTCRTTNIRGSLWNRRRVKYLGEFHNVLKGLAKHVQTLDKHYNNDDDDYQSSRFSQKTDYDDEIEDIDDDLEIDVKGQRPESGAAESGDEENEDSKQVLSWRGRPNPFKDDTLQYYLDPMFMKKMCNGENKDSEEDDDDIPRSDSCRTGKKQAMDQSMTDIFQHGEDQESLQIIKCRPIGDERSLASILSELPERLRPCWKPKYRFYELTTLAKERILDGYAADFQRKPEKKKKSILEEKNASKSDSYLDVLEICSKHIEVTPEYLESRLQRLERFIFKNDFNNPSFVDKYHKQKATKGIKRKRPVDEEENFKSTEHHEFMDDTDDRNNPFCGKRAKRLRLG